MPHGRTGLALRPPHQGPARHTHPAGAPHDAGRQPLAGGAVTATPSLPLDNSLASARLCALGRKRLRSPLYRQRYRQNPWASVIRRGTSPSLKLHHAHSFRPTQRDDAIGWLHVIPSRDQISGIGAVLWMLVQCALASLSRDVGARHARAQHGSYNLHSPRGAPRSRMPWLAYNEMVLAQPEYPARRVPQQAAAPSHCKERPSSLTES